MYFCVRRRMTLMWRKSTHWIYITRNYICYKEERIIGIKHIYNYNLEDVTSLFCESPSFRNGLQVYMGESYGLLLLLLDLIAMILFVQVFFLRFFVFPLFIFYTFF